MDRLGIQSLNAGAPDLRLSGDQTQRGTYTQRRRNQMAYGGIAGLDGRKAYGIGSWFQEQIKDPIKEKIVDPAIDFVTDNPMLTAAGVGLGINQFGIPFLGEGDVGQNWIGELLGNVTPGGTIDTVIGKGGTGQSLGDIWQNVFPGAKSLPGYTGNIDPTGSGMDYGIDDANLPTDWKARLAQQVMDPEMGIKGEALKYARGLLLGDQYGTAGLEGGIRDKFNQFIGGQGTQPTTTQTGKYPIEWQKPLAIGTGIGALDYLTRSDDTMPAQLALDPARFATAEAAKADPF